MTSSFRTLAALALRRPSRSSSICRAPLPFCINAEPVPFVGGVRFFSRQQYFAQNKEIAEYEKKRDWKGLLRFAKGKQGGFNDVNWSTLFSKLGRFKRDTRTIVRDPDFRSIMKGLEERVKGEGIEWVGVREVANTVHALGRMRVRSSVILGAVERDCERLVREGNPQDIANTIWAMATLQHDAPKVRISHDRPSVSCEPSQLAE